MTEQTEVKGLIAVATSDGEARADLGGCVDRLHQGQAARAALARLDAPRLRAVLDATGSALGQGSAQ
ncbi:hypothetical protein [Pedococcus sp. P5_B7]